MKAQTLPQSDTKYTSCGYDLGQVAILTFYWAQKLRIVEEVLEKAEFLQSRSLSSHRLHPTSSFY